MKLINTCIALIKPISAVIGLILAAITMFMMIGALAGDQLMFGHEFADKIKVGFEAYPLWGMIWNGFWVLVIVLIISSIVGVVTNYLSALVLYGILLPIGWAMNKVQKSNA